MVKIDELFDLTPYEQGQKLFKISNRTIASQLMKLWPINTPQYQLFANLHYNDSEYEDYKNLVFNSLYKAADSMSKECSNTIDMIKKNHKSELIIKSMEDMFNIKKTIKKESIDNTSFSGSTLKEAAECYDKIAAGAIPQLKKQRIRFRGAEKADNLPIEMLMNSILAHNLIYNTYIVVNDNNDLRKLSESAEAMPSFIAEVYNVSIEDLKDEYSNKLALKASNGNIEAVNLSNILQEYEESK